LLDFSRRTELSLHAAVIAEVTAAADTFGVELLIVGAFARDVGVLLDAAGRDRIERLLGAQSNDERAGPLIMEMDRAEPERPRRLLAAMLQGVGEAA
jgi:hypothetical protein